ncbi:beta-mannosidase [Ceratina calcarata]|uniref:Beta-mannosidase n=1 Tax=Ceratina calcarata TaxID=156304 RepID=A0AAJ7IXR7_9HYME|nr:beta-mannosidase [Ceratina calcarata]
MSDSMERGKTELMIRKEKEEEEEMKRELQDMEMYEPWYTYKDMKQILGAINESRDMANMSNDERNVEKKLTHSPNNWTPEAISKSQIQELEVQDQNDATPPIHSYRINRTSPVHERISFHGCSSPNLASTVDDSGSPVFRAKNFDNEDTYLRSQDNSNTRDSYYHTTNQSLSLKLKNSLQDSDPVNDPETTTMDEHSESEQTLERWQINPLDSCVDENDVPLPEPNRPLVEDRMPFRLCKDARTAEELEKLLPVLNRHLKQTAESWRSRRRTTTDDKFQWGSPIQVGHAKDKSDRQSFSNIETEQNQMECTNRHNERPTKRTSNSITSFSNEDQQISKKQKTEFDEDEDRALCSHKLASTVEYEQRETSNRISDHSNNKVESCETENEKESQECSSPTLTLRPKKITHPNVRKFLERRKDVTNPVKGLSDRLKNELMTLEKVQLEKQMKLEAEKEEARIKEMEERNRREEFFKKQLEERQSREQEKREREKQKEKQSKNWNARMETKSKRTVREELDEAPSLNRQIAIRAAGTVEDNRTSEDDDIFITDEIEATASGRISNVNCPICNKSFPSDRIETHAAECEQYTSDNECDDDLYLVESKPLMNTGHSVVHECNICSKYKTTNGIDYEDHVNSCLERQYAAKSSNGKITTSKREHEITFSATVPGGIYTDLSEARIIPENFIEDNDVNNRWVGNQSVSYSRTFYANDTLLNAPKVVLLFHGVDTFATILLNDQKIGETSNMFLRYTFDVTKRLNKGHNLLEVALSSPVKVAEDLYNRQASKYVVPPICVPDDYNGECHVNHIRKMQASFAWDWGPAFPSMGIWKSVEIVPVNHIHINDITTDIHKENDFWNVVIAISLETSGRSADCHISSVLKINDQSTISNSSSIGLNPSNSGTRSIMLLKVPTDHVREWWPNGYGDQTLYSLTVTASTLADVKSKTVRVGFRTVELVQEPLKRGLSFYFRINGVPIFAKGSNFIPASIFPESSAKADTVRHLLASAKHANMNMLRVWGGGLYESELFYDTADEYGIMIWQDFMFACGMYPTTKEFLDSVKEEVVQNVQRLKNHPSIIIWAGNNENEAALYGNWYGTGAQQIYKTDYVKLYVDVIKEEVERLDSTRPFVVSSPSNGLYTEKYNYIGEDPYSKFYGDVHYYNYFNNGWDVHQYPRVRFSSEYGFQSLPSIYTMLPVMKTINDSNIDGSFLKHRQHLASGTQYLKSLISKNLNIPETEDNLKQFKRYIYLSQINQAVSVKVETEYYRQSRSELNEIGEGMTMGALYWQLNDVWQAPSWSSIDFNGRWKMLHYYAMEFFAPIIVTYYIKNTDLSFYIVSDKLHAIQNATLEVNLYMLNSMKPVQTHVHRNIVIEANKAIKIHDDVLRRSWILNSTRNECQSNCITTLTLRDNSGSLIAPRNYIYPNGVLKNVVLPAANISVKVNNYQLPGRYYNYSDIQLELVTDNVALFVWMEAGNICGRFSENGFHMFETRKRIVFFACESITPEIFSQHLDIITLSDIY